MSRWLCLSLCLFVAIPLQAAVDEVCVDRCVADGYQPEHCAKDCAVSDAPVPAAAAPVPPPAETASVTIAEAVKLGRDTAAPAMYRDLAAAMARRANAFPRFERVITSSAVQLSPAMVQAIAGNEYAADIVYYLTWNETRAQQIAALPADQVPAAIVELERRLKPRSTP